MRVKLSAVAVLVLTVAGVSSWALAQDAASIESSRKDHFHQIGAAFKAVMDQTHASAPDFQIIHANAQTLEQLIAALPSWFPAGSGPESGVKTRAKAEVWTKASDFQEDARLAHEAAQDLVKASAGSDVSVVATSAMALGKRCGACHADFREKE